MHAGSAKGGLRGQGSGVRGGASGFRCGACMRAPLGVGLGSFKKSLGEKSLNNVGRGVKMYSR